MKVILKIIIQVIFTAQIFSQYVYWEPEIPTPGGEITIYYNVIEGILDNNTNPVYIHLGLDGWQDVDDYSMTFEPGLGDGWWSYKLCWRKHMRQFHADTSGKVEAEFFIGKGPLMGVEDGAVDELLYDIDPTNPTRARLVSEWFNGTVCDLTGKEREMVVYFVCPAGAGGSDAATTPGGGASTRKHTSVHSNGNMNHAIQADLEIVETGICMYQATLKHQAFCEVPELRSRSKPETIVRCTQDQNQRNEEEQQQRQYVEIGDFSSTSGEEQQTNSEEQEAESEQAFEVSN